MSQISAGRDLVSRATPNGAAKRIRIGKVWPRAVWR